MSAGRLLGVVVTVMVTLLAACAGERPAPASGGPPDAAPGWGVAAVRWLDAAERAGHEGVANLDRFLARDVVWDLRAIGGDLARGTDPVLSRLRGLDATHHGFTRVPPAYLGTDGVVLPVTWRTGRYLEVADAVLLLDMTRARLGRLTSAASVVTGPGLVERRPGPPVPDWPALDALADGYVAGLPDDVVLDEVPGGGGPAVYGVPRAGAAPGFRTAVLLLRADDGTGCPGRRAVVLTLDHDGGVIDEERYLAVADARRCRTRAELPAGWWAGVTPPEPVAHVRTGTLQVGNRTVEIWNASPALDGLVRWAFRRYAIAGLPAPQPASVSFYPDADRCVGHIAVAGGPAADEIVLCFGEPLACPRRPCPPWSARASTTVLHELAHTWMTQHLSESARERYEDLVGLSWWDEDSAWEERAVEHAAETIAWGLQRDPDPPYTTDIPDDELVAGFTLLTGRQPVSRR